MLSLSAWLQVQSTRLSYRAHAIRLDLDRLDRQEQAERRRKMYMKDWREKLDGFLRFNEREVLAHAGQISAELAKDRALLEYDKFQRRRLGEEARAADELDGLARDIEDEVRRRG